MYIINQPWNGREQQMGKQLIRLLAQDEPRFEFFRACVAFAKSSGILRLAPYLRSFIDRGSQVEIVVGVDEGITSQQALDLLMSYSSATYIFNNPSTTFHPKVYILEIPEQLAVTFIGSSNLTSGGLYTNYEANVGLVLQPQLM